MNIELYKTSGKKDKDIFYLYRTASEYICEINNKIVFNFNKENSFFNPDNFDEEKFKNNEKYYEEFYMMLVYLLLDIQKIGNKHFKDLQVIFLQQGIRDIMTSNRALQNERILILRYLVLSLNLAGNNKIEKDNFDNYQLGYIYDMLDRYELTDFYTCYEYLEFVYNKKHTDKNKQLNIKKEKDFNFLKKGFRLLSISNNNNDLEKLFEMNDDLGNIIIDYFYISKIYFNNSYDFDFICNKHFSLKDLEEYKLEDINLEIINKIVEKTLKNNKRINRNIIKNFYINIKYLEQLLTNGFYIAFYNSIRDLLVTTYLKEDDKFIDIFISLIFYDIEKNVLKLEESDRLLLKYINDKNSNKEFFYKLIAELSK